MERANHGFVAGEPKASLRRLLCVTGAGLSDARIETEESFACVSIQPVLRWSAERIDDPQPRTLPPAFIDDSAANPGRTSTALVRALDEALTEAG